MSDSPRSRIFARVQQASRPADADTIQRELESLGTAPSADLPAADLAIAFMVNVLKNFGTVDCVANRSGVVKAVAEYLYRHFRSHRLVAGNDPTPGGNAVARGRGAAALWHGRTGRTCRPELRRAWGS